LTWAAPVLTVGKIAALAGVRADTLRYYERERLLAPASKSSSGYRLYDSDALRRVRFIKHGQHCGFTLARLLSSWRCVIWRRQAAATCASWRWRRQLQARIRTMQTMSKALDRLIADCAAPTRSVDECPILSALDHADAAR
jgi:DNA-binding transcriptional MerR regulator